MLISLYSLVNLIYIVTIIVIIYHYQIIIYSNLIAPHPVTHMIYNHVKNNFNYEMLILYDYELVEPIKGPISYALLTSRLLRNYRYINIIIYDFIYYTHITDIIK